MPAAAQSLSPWAVLGHHGEDKGLLNIRPGRETQPVTESNPCKGATMKKGHDAGWATRKRHWIKLTHPTGSENLLHPCPPDPQPQECKELFDLFLGHGLVWGGVQAAWDETEGEGK